MDKSDFDLRIGELFFVGEREQNVNWHLTNQINPDRYILAYSKSGMVLYSHDGDWVTVSKGNVVFNRRNEVYSARADREDPWSFISVGFELEPDSPQAAAAIKQLSHVFRFSDSPKMLENFTELNRLWTARPPWYKLKCRSLLLDILYILLGEEKKGSIINAHYKRIIEIAETMSQNYKETYSLDRLSEMSGLSSSYFRTLFKQITGISPVQYQNNLKINKAKELLASRKYTVTEVAQEVGFRDIYYFSRLFRSLTGVPPSAYL